jgi:hypothetical protein
VLPVLTRRLRRHVADDTITGIAQGIYRHAWASNRMLWAQAVPVLEALERAGVPVVLLKGAALLPHYGDWGTRRMFDVDVLVRRHDVDVALGILDRLGWSPEFLTVDGVRARAVPSRHSVGFENGEGGQLDLHWHVLADSIGRAADDGFWAQRVPILVDDRPAYGLHPADALLNVLTHGTRGEVGDTSLQWVVDSVVIGRRYATGTGGDAFARRLALQARSHGQLGPVAAGLRTIAEIVDDPWVRLLLERLPGRVSVVERLRSRPEPGSALDQAGRALARHAAGGNGFRRGVAGLVRDRLQLDLARRPAVAAGVAACGRSRLIRRLARRAFGPLVTTPAPPVDPVDVGTVLDFTQPGTLDRFAGPGWAVTVPDGALTRGAEARLVVPIADHVARRGLVISLEVDAYGPEGAVEVLANESRVGRRPVGSARTTVVARVPGTVASRFTPLELSLRRVPAWPWRPLGLRLRRVAISDAPDC